MSDRDKLIELISYFCEHMPHMDGQTWEEACADHLLANGVTVAADNNDGCKYCTEYEDLPERFIDGKPHGKVFDTCIQDDEKGWHLELPYAEDIGILFCPMCGRRLPEPPKENE